MILPLAKHDINRHLKKMYIKTGIVGKLDSYYRQLTLNTPTMCLIVNTQSLLVDCQ